MYKICFIFALISLTYTTIYCVLCLCHFVFLLELDINKYVFDTNSNFNYNQSNSCCLLFFFRKMYCFFETFLKGLLLRVLNMLIFEMNCVLCSSLVTKQNQISQNVDSTAQCAITPPTKNSHHWLNQIQ